MLIYTRSELEERLHVDEREKIFLPNSIFQELKNAMTGNEKNRSSKHIPFAYAYVFLISYLWRYAKFGLQNGDYDYTEDELKRLLTVSGSNKNMNYITKKNGVLEQIGYIRKVSDYPIVPHFSNKVGNSYEAFNNLEFTMLSDLDGYMKESIGKDNLKNRKVNFPVRGYYGCKEHEEENYTDGYLFEIHEINNETAKGTHEVNIETFLFCMSNDGIGLEGFYIYQYLKYQSFNGDRFWNCAQKDFESNFGIDTDMVKSRLKTLEEHRMIVNTHEMMILGLPVDKNMPACAYKVNNPISFSNEKVSIPKRVVMSYAKAVAIYGESIFLNNIQDKFDLSMDLPF
ncbi:hypothetical protein ABEZ21_23940 [Brevibacillus porteri]|uniref:Uncharacterized protein n=1 Tax=Brevibacillus porteri TaxID=2126350 RepID=A0ABX5FHY8_9BACL|nr:hypothetical protein [Brevibacillus porteri]MED1803067.1 hypothetical protein [Brevibacillus porteri]MED2135333.1 hypothetical protein [Brevibacillus porteri]MED2748759.1 hypothetical protein [Brevibacillus porteri]MED2818411.1 hypothetical protein [Brevibacillus porteri]MED4899569.1 hypothetical protein [Brevibacillus porteri]